MIMSIAASVGVRVDDLVLPTFLPQAPDKNPMFLEKRVYQGSSGKVYPLPFTDRISESPVNRKWKAVSLENEFLRVLVLPEIGGRIHRIVDKLTDSDLIYYQPVIKPALVGLAGPWISGGIEFNWPQHHRPATFLPTDFHIEEGEDGSRTVWCSDHDPMARMKGMHGVCLRPGSACLELKVRVFNRTNTTQTFLWWANVATRVHEAYQSFFPPDVAFVADHARRAMSEYPLCRGLYYGVDYASRARGGVPESERPSRFLPPHCLSNPAKPPLGSRITPSLPHYAPNDLSFYANIPTPCSYMCIGSNEDFFGGYDHSTGLGLVHVANHHISPGKKQWTWGNHEFGYQWDRNLTDDDQCDPYIELMAGVYTDNQPDFSFLQPGETRTWSQFWYPVHKIGPAQFANSEAALSLRQEGAHLRIGVCVTKAFPNAVVRLEAGNQASAEWHCDLAPGQPFIFNASQPIKRTKTSPTMLQVLDCNGREIAAYTPRQREKTAAPAPATEPPLPKKVETIEELFIIGQHLEQYRHATRCPTDYWREAVRRDHHDARSNNALGRWHFRRGEFLTAEKCFRNAIERLTARNANPYDGEPLYNLGLTLTHLGRHEDAYAALYKATWNQAWASASFHALAEIDCRRENWSVALEHLDQCLRGCADNLRARNLKAVVLRKLGEGRAANICLKETLRLDPLDWMTRWLLGEVLACDAQTRLDLAHDCARAGLFSDALAILHDFHAKAADLPDQSVGTAPLIAYTIGWLHSQLGDEVAALASYRKAASESPDYCFPARLEEIAVLQAAARANPRDARAPYYLGNLLYDRRRHAEAIKMWERSAGLDPNMSVVWRNLGIGYFNISHDPARARRAYDKALAVNPDDARVVFERDQLWKRTGEAPVRRLAELERNLALVHRRDDLSIELCSLYNQTGQYEEALDSLTTRRFQPWEGGEGLVLYQWTRAHLALGRMALAKGDIACAIHHFTEAMRCPPHCGEGRHLLANQSDVHYWLGVALNLAGEKKRARDQWRTAASFRGDFQEMSVRAFSEMTCYSALSMRRLGQKAKANKLLGDLLTYGRRLERAVAKIDYFATSIPAMLLFDDDLQFRQKTAALFLEAQALRGLGHDAKAKSLVSLVLRRDPNHGAAADLRREMAGVPLEGRRKHAPMLRSAVVENKQGAPRRMVDATKKHKPIVAVNGEAVAGRHYDHIANV
jgi:tetratricopeptide (TPR) repeat protein